MKRYYFFVFIVSLIIIITGFFNEKLFDIIKKEIQFNNFSKIVERNLSIALSYHDTLMDINSLKNNIIGTRVIKKGTDIIYKSDDDRLIEVTGRQKFSDEEIKSVVLKVKELENTSKEHGAGFLYFAAPIKSYYEDIQEYIPNYEKENYDRFITEMEVQNVSYVNLAKKFEENNIPFQDIYFKTDHHWKPEIGFMSTNIICDELSQMYNFQYDNEKINLNNYEINTYKDYFLGSNGKKTGRFFTWYGAEDISLILPKFETNLTELQPFKNEEKMGDFKDSVLFMENIEEKDFYHKNPYATYSGGDFRLQIMKNNLNPEGKKILMVRDSYACAVAPFLALQTSELHIIDIRNYENYVGDKIVIKDYIEKIKPDYVIVLYSGINKSNDPIGRYDF